LWKKTKGNKISQLSPKCHEVIDVQNNRVSPSLNDILGYQKDSLRKLSKKKQRSHKHNKKTLVMDDYHNPFSLLDTINDGKDSVSNEPMSKQTEKKTIKEKNENGNTKAVNLREEVQENTTSISEINVKLEDNKTITKNESENCSELNTNQENQGKAIIIKRSCSEEDKIWNEIITEIDSLKQNFSVWPRESPSIMICDRNGYCEQLEKKESKGNNNVQYSDIMNQSDKLMKKKRKFWKKLVPKQIRKSKNKNKSKRYDEWNRRQESEMLLDDQDESETEVEDIENEDMKDSSSSSSDTDEFGEETNGKCHEISCDKQQNYIRTENKNDNFVKSLIIIIIPLIGLIISGRFFAFLVTLTVIGCIVLHKLRANTRN